STQAPEPLSIDARRAAARLATRLVRSAKPRCTSAQPPVAPLRWGRRSRLKRPAAANAARVRLVLAGTVQERNHVPGRGDLLRQAPALTRPGAWRRSISNCSATPIAIGKRHRRSEWRQHIRGGLASIAARGAARATRRDRLRRRPVSLGQRCRAAVFARPDAGAGGELWPVVLIGDRDALGHRAPG